MSATLATDKQRKLRISTITFDNEYSPIPGGLEDTTVNDPPRFANNYSQWGVTFARRAREANAAKLDALIGNAYYLIEVSPQGRRDYWQLSTEVPVTNRGVVRPSGWLGSTDNVNAHALGLWRVTGRSSTHLHLTAVDEA